MTEPDVELTKSELAAKKKLEETAKDLTQALVRKMQLSGGLDLSSMFITVQLLSLQLEVICQIFIESDPEFRELFWLNLSSAFDKAAVLTLKDLLVSPHSIRKNN